MNPIKSVHQSLTWYSIWVVQSNHTNRISKAVFHRCPNTIFPPYSAENELYRLGLTLPPSISYRFLPVPLCLYSQNESRQVQVEEPDGERDGGGGGMRGKGLITTFPNGASSVPKWMRVRLGMTDSGTNEDKQAVPMYQRIPTHSLNLSLVLPS